MVKYHLSMESIRMMTPFREEEEDESVFVPESNRTRRPRSADISSDEPHAHMNMLVLTRWRYGIEKLTLVTCKLLCPLMSKHQL